ncbi:MAG TPA: LacI family DNA-binding transcriptional regulator [Acidobacteriaceae bacterium]|nr:LacI family DNA-binding transcriptional regulator [Acidobacteriaceae bacterium]
MTKKAKHPTLREVARKAGVGTTTVSRVINGGERVDPKTLAKVRRVIDDLGYMPNHAARILKGGRTRTIGLVIPSIADPFFSSCAEAAQAVVRAHDSVLIVITTHNEPHAEVEGVNVLTRHRADGFIIAPADSRSLALRKLLQRISIPVVALDRPIEGSNVPSVVANNFDGAHLATQHLIEHGYRRIACLTGETSLYTIHERIRGYRHAVKSAGLDCILDNSLQDYASAESAVRRLFASPFPPDAIFTLKNSVTIHVFEALQTLNIAFPGTVALLGYDDFELADRVRPSISVIQQPIEELGRAAADLLFERLRDLPGSDEFKKKTRRQEIRLETRLIRRASCGCSPSMD